MYYEYAITAGEGTLIDFGVIRCEYFEDAAFAVEPKEGQTVIIAPCAKGCETGQ